MSIFVVPGSEPGRRYGARLHAGKVVEVVHRRLKPAVRDDVAVLQIAYVTV